MAKFCSSGWRRDLEYVLKVYYKHSIQASYREAEWARVRELFFEYFIPHKDEALCVKETSPLDFMPLIKELFWRAMGLHLHRLRGFTLWIKQGSYYHGLVAQQGHLQRCPHLIRAPLPRWPQIKPSKSCRDSHKRAEALAAGSSEPSARATATPVQETPVEEPPVMEPPATETPVTEPPATETPATEAPASDTPSSDTPAPMETGGAGDGQSWAAQVEAGLEAEFQEHRPTKRCWSLSRKWKARPRLPFPLQDTEGRLASVLRLYEHAREQPAPCDNVAGRGIMHLHLEMLPREARCLGNQVICIIAEYHLTSSARVLSSLSLVLLEAAKPLLPPIKSYVPGITFVGTRDVRVLDHAKTLRVAVWLHQLDMSIRGDELASKTLEVSQHHLGLLLQSFLAPTTSNLTFHEVVDRVLHENQCNAECRLEDLRAHHAQIRQELDDLIQAHRESEKSSRKRIKNEIDTKCKDLESFKRHISQCESHLEQDTTGDDTPNIDDLLDQGAEMEMATTPGTMPWRWMKGVLSHLELVLSPMRRTTC